MHYLLLAICSSSLIAVMMRISETRVRNNISELAVNYAVCLILNYVGTLSCIVIAVTTAVSLIKTAKE